GGVEAEVRDRAIAALAEPLGVLPGVQVAPADGVVDGGPHADRVARLDLLAQQVDFQVRVLRADAGRVVRQPVVALGEDRDRVHVPELERLLELPAAETGADVGDVFGGVEVEVNLAGGQFGEHGGPSG